VKQTADLDRIQEQMRPGVLTQPGFLGPDGRKLADILDADGAAVLRLGLTHRRIAERLAEFRAAGIAGLGTDLPVAPHFEVRVDGARGALPCPFGHPGLHDKTFTLIRNLRLGEELACSDLQLHLIAEHGFYEGEGSPYRLAPERLARVLELA
jgi:hypothetical protein